MQVKSWGAERLSSLSAVTRLVREQSGLELTYHAEKGSSAVLSTY